MTHGFPDWGVTSGYRITYQVKDLGELAVRLGSIVSFDRRGEVLYLDDFSGGMKGWVIIKYGEGAGAYITYQCSTSGLFAAKIVGGTDDYQFASISRKTLLPPVSRIGIGLHFGVTLHLENFEIALTLGIGKIAYTPKIRFFPNTGSLEYFHSTLGWQILDTLAGYPEIPLAFAPVKLVVDPTTGFYTRLIYIDKEYDLSAVPMPETPYIRSPEIQVAFTAYSGAVENGVVIVDNYILTHNEP